AQSSPLSRRPPAAFIPLPPLYRPPPTPPPFPYTTLFRSRRDGGAGPRSRRTAAHGSRCLRRARRPRWVPPDAHVRRRTAARRLRSEEHTSELQSRFDLVCRLLLEKKK